MKTLLCCGLAVALLAGEARAIWVRVSQNYQIAHTQYVIDPGHPDYLERGWLTKGAGGHASGEVVAEDRYFLGHAPSVQLVGTGYSYEHWRHLPPGVGEIELVKWVEIAGVAELTNYECGAAALGASSARHAFDGVWSELRAELRHSAAETTVGVAGSVSIGYQGTGLTAPVPILHHGPGVYRDDGGGRRFEFARKCPVTNYEEDLRTSLRLSARANESLTSSGDARGRASGAGYTYLQAIFLTLPQCP